MGANTCRFRNKPITLLCISLRRLSRRCCKALCPECIVVLGNWNMCKRLNFLLM